MSALLSRLREAGVIEALDRELALSLGRAAGENDEHALIALALTSSHARDGHVCVDLSRLATTSARASDGSPLGFDYPPLATWQRSLLASPLVGSGKAPTPLVLSGGRKLYLRRHFQDEEQLAEQLSILASGPPPLRNAQAVRDLASRLWPAEHTSLDRQKLAAELATLSRLAIITGGPGTGKTTTVAGLLALLARHAQVNGSRFRPLLLAPTGKAAARLSEAVSRAVGALDCPSDVISMIPTDARTIHRGLEAGRSGFRIGRDRPFLADVVVVDEASMVDLGLMRRVVDGIPRSGRLVLLGDPYQLSSVEAGAVLSDITGGTEAPRYSRTLAGKLAEHFGERLPDDWVENDATALDDSIVRLVKSHRFAAESAMGRLARAVQRGAVDAALECFGEGEELTLIEPRGAHPAGSLEELLVHGFKSLCEAETPEQALTQLGSFRVLCAHRKGPFGVESLNERARKVLVANRLIRDGARFQWPVMILENETTLDLANGDVGVVWRDPSGETRACFPRKQGHRFLSLARLPPHEPAFAMSVHKSQGSEWDTVIVLLPDPSSPLLSRELLYTAITRARRRLIVHGTRDAIAAAIERRIARASGLFELLHPRPTATVSE